MIKIIYFDERELLVRREIETKTLKNTEAEVTKVLPRSKLIKVYKLKDTRHSIFFLLQITLIIHSAIHDRTLEFLFTIKRSML